MENEEILCTILHEEEEEFEINDPEIEEEEAEEETSGSDDNGVIIPGRNITMNQGIQRNLYLDGSISFTTFIRK